MSHIKGLAGNGLSRPASQIVKAGHNSSQPSYFASEKTLSPSIKETTDEKNEREKVVPQTAIFQKPTRIEDYKEKFRSRLE